MFGIRFLSAVVVTANGRGYLTGRGYWNPDGRGRVEVFRILEERRAAQRDFGEGS